MFKIGDKLKVNVAAYEPQISEWKGSQVYDNMIQAATEKRFEVVGMDNINYAIKRLEDDQVIHENKTSVHTNFELAND